MRVYHSYQKQKDLKRKKNRNKCYTQINLLTVVVKTLVMTIQICRNEHHKHELNIFLDYRSEVRLIVKDTHIKFSENC